MTAPVPIERPLVRNYRGSMKVKRPDNPLSRQLRATIKASGLTNIEIAN
jgi:hypothetical protein